MLMISFSVETTKLARVHHLRWDTTDTASCRFNFLPHCGIRPNGL